MSTFTKHYYTVAWYIYSNKIVINLLTSQCEHSKRKKVTEPKLSVEYTTLHYTTLHYTNAIINNKLH